MKQNPGDHLATRPVMWNQECGWSKNQATTWLQDQSCGTMNADEAKTGRAPGRKKPLITSRGDKICYLKKQNVDSDTQYHDTHMYFFCIIELKPYMYRPE